LNRGVSALPRSTRSIGGNQAADLSGHRFGHVRWSGALCNERRYRPQRRLFVGKSRELLVRLAYQRTVAKWGQVFWRRFWTTCGFGAC
jgi:hypothetical protein